MKTTTKILNLALVILFTAFSFQGMARAVTSLSDTVAPASPPAGFKHQFATVNGVKIHYVTGGKGEPLLLVHGFGQNWYMWNRLLPELSKHFTVIAPDLRGVGRWLALLKTLLPKLKQMNLSGRTQCLVLQQVLSIGLVPSARMR